MSRVVFLVTKDITRKMKPIKGLKPAALEVDELVKPGGLSNPKSGVVPVLVFSTVGVPELQKVDKRKKGYFSIMQSNIVRDELEMSRI